MCPRATRSFCQLALGWAEAAGAHDLFIGVNALDYSGYPDCRPDFIAAFENARESSRPRPASRAILSPSTPRCCTMSKADIAREAARLGLDAGNELVLLRPYARGSPLRPLRQLPPARKGLCRGRPDRSGRSMSYAVKECFLTLQGEGMQAGSARGVPALCRVQSVERARTRSRHRPMPFLRHRFRRNRWIRRRQVRRRRRCLPTGLCRSGGRGSAETAGRRDRRRAHATARRRR